MAATRKKPETHSTDVTDRAERTLEQRIADRPDDAVAHYRLGILLLASRDLYQFYARDSRRVVARAEQLLQRAVALDPTHARAQATLGFALHQLERLDDALACFRSARTLDPKNETYDVYVPTLLVELEREKEALAEINRVGRRRKANLTQLRRELAKAKFKADATSLLMNGFIRARNFMWSWLSDEAERIRNSLTRGRKQRVAKAETDECEAFSRALQKDFRRSQVPASLRPLAAAAARYGIGDDGCRPLLMKRIPKAQKTKLVATANRLANKVHAWLDTFPSGQMSVEAAAFMYLMNGLEE